MAVTRLADIYNPLTFARRIQEAQVELNAFLSSGIAVNDPLIGNQIAAGGNIGEITHFAPLATREPNYSTDDPDETSTPQKISSKKQVFRTAPRNDSWSTMDLARELAFDDPAGAITGRIGAFWATDIQTRLINKTMGLLADNIANDNSDMVVKVGTDASGAVSDAERFSATSFIDALQTLGDHKGMITAIAMHSVTHSRMMKQGLIDTIRDADNNVDFQVFLGKYRVIIDDSLPAVAQTNRILYTSVLFGAGVFGTANGQVLNPTALDRKEDAGNGSGQDILHSRIHDVWHPYGFTFNSSAVAGQSATYTELATAGNWDRVVDRKNVPLAFLQTNE